MSAAECVFLKFAVSHIRSRVTRKSITEKISASGARCPSWPDGLRREAQAAIVKCSLSRPPSLQKPNSCVEQTLWESLHPHRSQSRCSETKTFDHGFMLYSFRSVQCSSIWDPVDKVSSAKEAGAIQHSASQSQTPTASWSSPSIAILTFHSLVAYAVSAHTSALDRRGNAVGVPWLLALSRACFDTLVAATIRPVLKEVQHPQRPHDAVLVLGTPSDSLCFSRPRSPACSCRAPNAR